MSAEDSAVELRHLITQALSQEFSLLESAAFPMADRITERLFQLAGGTQVYIPKNNTEKRNAAIRAEFNGRNVDDICRRYGLSRSQLYRIAAK